jgi:hypothetical protein
MIRRRCATAIMTLCLLTATLAGGPAALDQGRTLTSRLRRRSVTGRRRRSTRARPADRLPSRFVPHPPGGISRLRRRVPYLRVPCETRPNARHRHGGRPAQATSWVSTPVPWLSPSEQKLEHTVTDLSSSQVSGAEEAARAKGPFNELIIPAKSAVRRVEN